MAIEKMQVKSEKEIQDIEAKQQLKQQYKKLKNKDKPTKISEVVERLEILEKLHDL